MENKGLKGKFYEVLKNDVSVELHKLTVDSGDYNNDVHEANEEFEKLFRTVDDKQDEFMTRSLLIEEQYRATIAVLEGENKDTGGDSSGENIVLPPTYAADGRRFAEDVKTSLKGHGVFFTKEYEEMERIIQKYEVSLKEKMEELKRRAALIDRERVKLSLALHNFIRSVPEDSDEDED